MATYRTRDKQNVYDLAIQLYGDLSKIGNLIKLFPNLDNEIALGSSITVEDQVDPMALYFSNNNIIVATDFIPISSPVGPDHIILETGDSLLLETGDLLLLE